MTLMFLKEATFKGLGDQQKENITMRYKHYFKLLISKLKIIIR